MLTIVQGNRNIYTISKGETDWKAGAKLWPYCKWLPYCSIWRAPPPTWWLYFPLDLWLSPESRRPPPRVCAASPAERDERQWDERRRWAGGRQRSLLVGSCWQRAAFFYLLFVFFLFFSTASKVLITEALERHRVTDEEKGNGWSGARNPGSIKTWLSSAAKRCKVHKQRQRLQLQSRNLRP